MFTPADAASAQRNAASGKVDAASASADSALRQVDEVRGQVDEVGVQSEEVLNHADEASDGLATACRPSDKACNCLGRVDAASGQGKSGVKQPVPPVLPLKGAISAASSTVRLLRLPVQVHRACG